MHHVEKKTIATHDGLKLYYETHGLEENKRVIFFVHGIGGDADAWHFIRQESLALGYACITMDLRGHGHSAHPKIPASYELKHLIQDISTILSEEKIPKIILIGHSYGAVIAAYFAIEHPEVLEKLVLISGTFLPPAYMNKPWRKKVAHKIIDFAARVSLPPIKPGHSTYPPGKFHKDVEWFGLARTILRNSWRSYLMGSKLVLGVDLEDKLSGIQVPMLLIAGTKDSIFTIEEARKIHAKTPNAKFETIEGGNHGVELNNVKETADLIHRFIAE